ncbi:hypothetical protein [Pseudomonas sp. R5-89-07]|uniref:hypothetical protein n=1 Tax=Pseudomonas sp. R5-89-07 TaxID=658644 RepID=UPI0013DE79AE|nr:hypothetical protein [Pseudomonas sp. R5-89-07]
MLALGEFAVLDKKLSEINSLHASDRLYLVGLTTPPHKNGVATDFIPDKPIG